MKVAVLGVGRMGQAICYAANKLGCDVIGADSYEGAASNFRKYISGPEGAFYLLNEEKTFERALIFEKPDVVVSSLPYHQTEEVARWCIENGTRYCDLGGRVDVSRRINEYAKEKAKKPVFTDLGLAPGWANILAEHGCKQLHSPIDSVKMMVGGLPTEKVNHPLDYVVTWSIDGLINEYKDSCEVLMDGEMRIVPGMSHIESVDCPSLGKLEAFCTSGGASHTLQSMKDKGVKNCAYKTLRYEGHRDIVNFLIKNQSEECVREVFEKGCKGGASNDVVLIKVFVNGEKVQWKEELAILGDAPVAGELEGFSAMQKATAFPIASMAYLMAEGNFDGDMEQRRNYWIPYPKSLSYSHVPYDKFREKLVLLGLNL